MANNHFNMKRTATNFNKIKANSQETEVLDSLYNINKILFDESFIETILTLAEKNEYTVNDFSDILSLKQSSILSDFSTNTNEATNKGFEFILDVYFNAITTDKIISATTVKIKICTLLKMKMSIPSYNNALNIKHVVVSISSSYKPKETERATAACDITNIIKQSFFSAIENAPVRTFMYTPHNASVFIQGPVLNMMLNNMLQLQENLLQVASSCGVKVEPFIVNNSSNKII